jgi:hypothetical protein
VREREICRQLVTEAKQKQEEDELGEYIHKTCDLPGQMKNHRNQKALLEHHEDMDILCTNADSLLNK